MNATEVRRLPIREKLQLMEILWEDVRLSAESSSLSSDERKLLDRRIERVVSGEATMLDWDGVKHSIGSE